MQEQFVFSPAKFPAFVGGFGSGKTHALVARSIIGKLHYPKLNRAYFAPTWDLIKLIAWPRFEELCETHKIRYRLHRGDKYISFDIGGRIYFRTLEVPQRIVGFEVADADIDELDTLPLKKAQECWNRVIARCRQRKPDGLPNTVSVGTTPEGFRFVYERWKKHASKRYELHHSKTRENYLLPDDYIPSLEETYPPQLLKAYLDGEFVNMTSGSVYAEFDRGLNGTDAQMQPGEPLHIGMDFNVMNMHAVTFVIRDGHPMAVDELVKVKDTPAMASLMRERYGDKRSIVVYPDPAGKSTSSKGAGESDFSILREHKFHVEAHKSHPLVRDRVNAVNAQILNAKQQRRLRVNTDRCPVFTEALEKQPYDANGEPDKTLGFDHPNDAAGYFIQHRFPIVKPVTALNIGFAN